jgi:positive regulator of sigma E activity
VIFLEIANVITAIALTIIGLYLAHSYRRQLRLRVAEQRLVA